MDITIHASFMPHTDAEAALGFYRDALGFEVRQDVGYQDMRWITVGPPGQPDVNIVLYPPTADPNITEEEGQVITEMIAKGTFTSLMLASADVDAAFAAVQAHDVDVVQEPTDQDWGMRDCAFRDPAGNMVRMQQVG